MRINVLRMIILAVASFDVAIVQVWGAGIDNETMSRVIENIEPIMTDCALSTRYVRTSYKSQSLQSTSKDRSPEVERTTISELTVMGLSNQYVTLAQQVCLSNSTHFIILTMAFVQRPMTAGIIEVSQEKVQR